MNSKKLWSTMLSLIATVIVLFAFGGMTVLADDTEDSDPEIVAQGYCGAEGNEESVSWALDSNGLLTISGTGRMRDYYYNAPWFNKGVIENVVIGEGVTSIGDYAFYNCTLLTTITIPNSVTSIGDYAFFCCTSLATIAIPNSVTSIGNSAFGCTALSSIVIPNSVTSIGNDAFYGCTSLTSITIPDSVTSIGESAFEGCRLLSTITISDSVTSIGDYAFYKCTSLTTITIPNSVTSIGNNAFHGCTSLTSITIPNSVTSIGDNAFRDCTSLTSITIPDSVTSIGTAAFGDCVNLTEIRLKVNSDSFNDVLSNIFPTSIKALVYVPNDNLETYRYLFSSFENVIVLDLDGNFSLQDSGLHLYGYSLSLDGSIGVNFYMKLGDEVLNNSSTAFMRFTVNGKEQNVPVKDLTRNKDGYYIFRCNVVAKEMADEITEQVYLSENNPVGDAYTYSVREYAAYILDHPEGYSVQAVELVKAMLNYGAAAQTYFGYHTSDLANSILPEGEQQSNVSAGSLSVDKKGDILPELVSISLKSTITMKLYFKTEDLVNVTSFEYKNQALTTTVSGEYTVIVIEGIPAQNFTGIMTINYYVEGSGEPEKIKYRPSNYAYAVLTKTTDDTVTEELKNVVSALYSFSRAANEYNGGGIQPA